MPVALAGSLGHENYGLLKEQKKEQQRRARRCGDWNEPGEAFAGV